MAGRQSGDGAGTRDEKRQRPRRRALRALSWLLIFGGVLIAAVPGAQRGYAGWSQWQLEKAFFATAVPAHAGSQAPQPQADVTPQENAREDADPASAPPARRSPAQALEHWAGLRVAFHEDPVLARPEHAGDEQAPRLPPDDRHALLEMPSIGVRAIVAYGTDRGTLARGPGFYPEGAMPGQGGNTAIAAHRTTYGAWFRDVDRLEEGDPILLTYRGVRYEYSVRRVWVIDRNDWSVIAPADEDVLTLTTCHPPGFRTYRLAVRAVLIGAEAIASTSSHQAQRRS